MLTGHQTQGMLFAELECFQKTDSIMSLLKMSGDLFCQISAAVFFNISQRCYFIAMVRKAQSLKNKLD